MTKRLQQDELQRSEYLSEIGLRYRDGAFWPKARKKSLLLCPHCELTGVMTPFKDKQSFWTHIKTQHPSVKCRTEHPTSASVQDAHPDSKTVARRSAGSLP